MSRTEAQAVTDDLLNALRLARELLGDDEWEWSNGSRFPVEVLDRAIRKGEKAALAAAQQEADEDGNLSVRIPIGVKPLPVPDFVSTDLGDMPIQNLGYEALNVLLENLRMRMLREAGVRDLRGG